jgi:hypothetical protein
MIVGDHLRIRATNIRVRKLANTDTIQAPVDAARPHVALVVWFTRQWVTGLTTLFPETARIGGMLAHANQGLGFGRAARDAVAPLMEAMPTASSARRLVLLLDVLTTLG